MWNDGTRCGDVTADVEGFIRFGWIEYGGGFVWVRVVGISCYVAH